jgi:hypothetical protein
MVPATPGSPGARSEGAVGSQGPVSAGLPPTAPPAAPPLASPLLASPPFPFEPPSAGTIAPPPEPELPACPSNLGISRVVAPQAPSIKTNSDAAPVRVNRTTFSKEARVYHAPLDRHSAATFSSGAERRPSTEPRSTGFSMIGASRTSTSAQSRTSRACRWCLRVEALPKAHHSRSASIVRCQRRYPSTQISGHLCRFCVLVFVLFVRWGFVWGGAREWPAYCDRCTCYPSQSWVYSLRCSVDPIGPVT